MHDWMFNDVPARRIDRLLERKEMFYLMTHSSYFIYGYMIEDHSDSQRGNPRPTLHWLLFSISSKGSFCMQDSPCRTGWNEE